MATLFYAVFEGASEVALGDPVDEGTVAITGASLASGVITGNTRPKQRMRVRIMCDTNAFVTWGADPTALNDGSAGRPMGSENPEFFDIEAGHKIACIQRV